MEAIFSLPFTLLTVPNLKIRKPSWIVKPSPMFVFTLALFSYFLVTAGMSSSINPPPLPTHNPQLTLRVEVRQRRLMADANFVG